MNALENLFKNGEGYILVDRLEEGLAETLCRDLTIEERKVLDMCKEITGEYLEELIKEIRNTLKGIKAVEK